MAGNTRFEFTSASPESGFAGNYQNGQRAYSASTLDRSMSFRDGMEGRNFASGKANSRGSTISSGDGTALSQCLMLDQIVIDQKHARFIDIRRVLAFSIGGSSEDNSFGTAPVKNPPPTALDEMKRLKASITDSGLKASSRAKKLDDQLIKLNKYLESVSSKKQQQRNEMLTSERSGGSTLKIGSLMHRNPADFGSQKFDDRPKNGGLNKRVRTSVAETRADFRNNGVLRQPLTVTKERDLLKDSNVDSEIGEEKIRRLPAGGEGWDKKMKRKRSVGAVFPRSADNDGELKRTVHHKLTNESSLQSSDSTNSFRSGTSGGSNKLDPSPPAGSSVRATLKNEQEKSMLSRDGSVGPIKERTLGKLSVRINNREENHAVCPSPILKGKASRTPRSGSVVAANSNSTVPRVPGTLESWDQPQAVNRTPTASGAINRKRPMPAGSSSPPITQWGGQRPQKSSRTRRTNLVPVPNHDDVQMQAEGGSPSDFSPRLSTGATSGSLPTKSSGSGNQNSKAKPETVSSPARLSESEESGSGQFRVKEKGIDNADAEDKDANACPNVGPSIIPVKKNKIMVKDEIGDGVRRQGRSGRVSPFSRTSISSTREKLETLAPNKPLRNARSGSDKNGSKSGRPMKKLSDRKGFSRLGHMANGSSPDCSGESEDDREDLLEAANLAWNSSLNACSSAFWKTVESLFASIGPDEISFLSEQLKLAEESSRSSHQNSSHAQEESGHEEIVAPDSISFRRYGQMKNGTEFKNSSDRVESVEQLQNSSVFESSEAEKASEVVTPLYQRVLSALIEEDEIEEFEETGFGMPSISVADSHILIGAESKHMDKRNLCEPSFGVQTPKNGNHVYLSCNGNADFARGPSSQDHLSNGELHERESGYVHSEVEVLVRLSRCDYVSENVQTKNCGFSSFHHQYEQMSFEEKLVLELQSIGLFVEAVPALDDKEDEVINEEINQLERGLHEQVRKKKSWLNKMNKDIEEGKNIGRRDPEQVAMDRLIELAYKKLLATRRTFASKHGIPMVSKPVALAFARRMLARCQKFNDSGASCFSYPPLRDIIFAKPPRFNETELLNGGSLAVANDGTSADAFDTSIHQSDHTFAKNGPISNRAKRKELLLDDVGGAVFRASSALGILDGAKGKRSERDRDASTRNTVVKAGRLSMGASNGERKPKSKPKQKITQLSSSTNGFTNKFTDATNTGSGESANNNVNKRKDVRFMSSGNVPPVSSNVMKESMEFTDIDGMEELGVDSVIGEQQDLNSFLNFEMDDGLQDHDAIGLDIPMDDLAELDMF